MLLMWYFLYYFNVKASFRPFHKYCMHLNPLVFSLSEAWAVFLVPKVSAYIYTSSSHHPPLPVPEMGPIIPLAARLLQC